LVAALLMAVGVGVFGTIAGGLASWFSHPTESDGSQLLNAELHREIIDLRRLVVEQLNTASTRDATQSSNASPQQHSSLHT
jgi:hypothetical protein